MKRLLTVLLISSALFGCGNFRNLSNEIEAIDSITNQYMVTLSQPASGSAVVIEQIKDINKGEVDGYDGIIDSDSIHLHVSNNIHYLLIFEDKNQDLTLQADEAFSMINLRDHEDRSTIEVSLTVNESKAPSAFVDRSLSSLLKIELDLVDIGTVVDLSDPPFEKGNAKLGMWQPLTFLLENNAGLYFLSEYDPNKIPILFVHGINTTALDFAPLIEKVDQSKYQIWVFNYPSGLSLALNSKGLNNLLHTVVSEYKNQQLHVVTHSMGGLIVTNSIRQCRIGQLCDFVSSVTTISSPFGGVESAKQGVEYSPVVMPAWVDLNPEGKFIADLFIDNNKIQIPHFLAFGYNSGELFNTSSNDGVISLSSQLSRPAQLNAEQILGYDENHLSILDNDDLFEDLSEFWLRADQ
ncbi:Alpha/beta hydrolase family protein [Vibrio crassostreae]|uniref:lipase family alpha/beta hydrolase n=1 Tax=Vibrio crassostreae TaxID=246167 RepID=UPI001B30BC5E|nr:alpha/beta fold hydrolase [Vibrio crassostreae]CAK2112620.1 Alpha/beta hydrolase family protein [Vibrio crassostreae]CAK2117565.1 Alpha/beta hydrolase family protein [Vibrio crassostreae]CAK2123579.1 Alpha/beta hydrolase family protein [Vibrio crassostreae]CAK2124344.1 Alpha/beta hydrolase family protein [Vibrio crassostreae]CAK2125349.1 Alpha/beta hydrolase family protein [Vibrio crassostreae]